MKISILLALLCLPLVAQPPACNRQWTFYGFGCDNGHNNFGPLNRDGTPTCGTGNCTGNPPSGQGPGNCWQALPSNAYAQSNGAITTGGIPQDFQLYGTTYLWVPTSQSINVTISASNSILAFWLNGTFLQVIPNTPNFVLTLNLVSGWNQVEFTTYNQNSGHSFQIHTQIGNLVPLMHTDTSCGTPYIVKYTCGGPNPLNPPNSITQILGLPKVGTGLSLIVDHPDQNYNPPVTQIGGPAYAIGVFSVSAAPQFPCGPAISDWNMLFTGAQGSLLVSVAPQHFLGYAPPSGVLWSGSPVAIPVNIPFDYNLVGFNVYGQVFIVDPGPSAPNMIQAGAAVHMVIGI